MPRAAKPRLYQNNIPTANFNETVLKWLRGEIKIPEHQKTAAFEPVRTLFDAGLKELTPTESKRESHRTLLSNLTTMLLGVDLTGHLSARLIGNLINETGFRTALSQGAAKNNGENFVNAIVYSIAQLLRDQDEVLVDKGTPPPLREELELRRTIKLSAIAAPITMHIPVECDFAIFSRSNPRKAIIVSAKTRLKEVFHVGTMWKLLFDMIEDEYCAKKWGVTSSGSTSEMKYCFATADMIPPGGKKTQGPDVERDEVRNLIAMDASFFDYVFVSKADIPHVSKELNLTAGRETLFHELGCLIDLIEQTFGISMEPAQQKPQLAAEGDVV